MSLQNPYAGFIEEGLAAQALTPGVSKVKPLTPKEKGMIAKVIDLARPKPVHSMTGCFLLYRSFMGDRLKEALTRGIRTDAALLRDIALQSWQAFIPHWVGLAALSLGQGYRDGIRAAAVGEVPDELTYEVAQGYARLLGEDLNATSVNAMMSGYQAQVNRKVPPALAAKRVAEAFGVPPRVMNGLVTLWLRPDTANLTDQVPADIKKRQADQIINRAVAERAGLIGDTEVFTAKSQGQQLAWARARKLGILPKSAKRVWQTADDERVCPVCGPMHHKTSAVNGVFKVAGKQVWTPPMHPNCRCTVKLALRNYRPVSKAAVTTVIKAQGSDPFSRDARGRFSSSESRRNKPVRTKQVNPHTRQEEDLARQLKAYQAEQRQKPVVLDQVKLPFVQLGIDVNRLINESEQALKPVVLDQVKLGGVKLGGVSLGVKLPEPDLNVRLGGDVSLVGGVKMSDADYEAWQAAREKNKIYLPDYFNLNSIPVRLHTPDGDWMLMDEELTALFRPSEKMDFYQGGTVKIPNNRALLLADELGDDQMATELSDHWSQFADRAEADYLAEAKERGKRAWQFESDETTWTVTQSEYRQIMDSEIDGKARETMTTLHGVDRDGRVITRPFARNILSRDLGIADLVHDNTPTMIRMIHGRAGHTDIKPDRRGQVTHAYNGGNWKVKDLEVEQHRGGLVNVAYVMPDTD